MIYKYVIFIGLFFVSGLIYSQNTDLKMPRNTSTDSRDPSLEIQLVPLDQIIDIALANSPYLKFDSTMVSVKENDVILQKRRWQNNISAFANYSGGNQGFLLTGSSSDIQNNVFSGYRFGVNIGLPLGDITNRKIYIRKSQAELHSSQFKMDQTEMSLRQQVISAYNNLITAQKLLKIKTSARENALVVQEMADKQFREGVTSLEAYASVSTMTVHAEADYEQVKSTFNTLYLQFEEMVGVKLTTLMNKK